MDLENNDGLYIKKGKNFYLVSDNINSIFQIDENIIKESKKINNNNICELNNSFKIIFKQLNKNSDNLNTINNNKNKNQYDLLVKEDIYLNDDNNSTNINYNTIEEFNKHKQIKRKNNDDVKSYITDFDLDISYY